MCKILLNFPIKISSEINIITLKIRIGRELEMSNLIIWGDAFQNWVSKILTIVKKGMYYRRFIIVTLFYIRIQNIHNEHIILRNYSSFPYVKKFAFLKNNNFRNTKHIL